MMDIYLYISMMLLHEIHALELQTETNVYDLQGSDTLIYAITQHHH